MGCDTAQGMGPYRRWSHMGCGAVWVQSPVLHVAAERAEPFRVQSHTGCGSP